MYSASIPTAQRIKLHETRLVPCPVALGLSLQTLGALQLRCERLQAQAVDDKGPMAFPQPTRNTGRTRALSLLQ